MKLLLIRHGANAGDPFARPQFPVRGFLSEAGIAQAGRLRDRLADVRIDAAISSPYGRAMETAQIALEGRGLEIAVRDGLEEWHPVQLERGVPSTEYEKMMERDRLLYAEETWKTEQGEGAFDVLARVVPAFLGAMAEVGWHCRFGGWVPDPGAEGKTVALFAHGGSLGAMMTFLLGVRPFPLGSFSFSQTGMAEIEFCERRGIFYPCLRI